MANRKTSDIAASPKRSKPDPDSLEERAPITYILALNDDCLVKVFEYLNEYELLNVIQTNTRFQVPCERCFKQKYCSDPITVSNVDVFNQNGATLMHSVRILENFGHLISKLRVPFKTEKVASLLDAIVANCDKNILEVEFQHLGTRIKVNSMAHKIGNKKMRTFLANMGQQFKNLRQLKFDYCNKWKQCPYSDEIVQTFPSLKSFAISEVAAGLFWSEEKLKDFIGLNPHVECLSILFEVKEMESTDRSWHLTKSFIRYLDDTLPLLKSLEINRVSLLSLPDLVPPMFEIFDFRTETEPPVDQFPNLKEFTLGCFPEFYGIDFGFMSFRSNAVEVLRLSNFDYNIHYFIMHVTQFTNLQVLELEFAMNLFSSRLDPNRLNYAVWRPNGIREIISNNAQLTKIIVRPHPCEADQGFLPGTLATETEYRDAIKSTKKHWQIFYDDDCLRFERMSQ